MIHTEQRLWTEAKGWETITHVPLHGAPQLVFAFGARKLVGKAEVYQQIRNFYPGAYIVLCSTAGEILGTEVHDGSIALTAVHFEKSVVRFAETTIANVDDSLGVGKRLAEFLPVEGLVHAMVFSDGLGVNGTLLVKGINDNLPVSVTVTGGLVGDGADFKETLVGRDGPGEPRKVVLLGFYGDALKVGFGSYGGWEGSGAKHTITRSLGNILFEIDDKPALAVYKQYLGDKVSGLPSSALLFPLKLHVDGGTTDVVRTILGVNEVDQSMTFAGDMPRGVTAEFMKATLEKLVEGAGAAATMSFKGVGHVSPELAILISCVGRKLVLKKRVAEEVEAVRSVLGEGTAIGGFYSYGELCPGSYEEHQCLLHNQTMTITVFREF
ncbi:MAG: FIST N-terminal domain-containing protein [Patescibacteria group bacterium]